jgi:type II secretory ATPase GspE/PulE/Tfp pilus assembly ATPase PilB-like protein
MRTTYDSFGKQLLEKKLITQKQLDDALERQRTSMSNRKLGEIWYASGLSARHRFPNLSPNRWVSSWSTCRTRKSRPGSARWWTVPLPPCTGWCPWRNVGDTLIVATADPTNINTLDNLGRLLDRPVEPVMSTPEAISEALGRYYGHQRETVESMLSSASSASSVSSLSSMSNMSASSSLASFGSLSAEDISLDGMSMDSKEAADAAASLPGISEFEDDSPVVRYVQQLIIEAYRMRASDIHIEPAKTSVKVRYRIDGVMQEMPLPPKRAQKSILSPA